MRAHYRFGRGGPPCLLLHGFTGSPWDLEPLADALAEQGFSGQVPLLPGHGGTGEAMATVSMTDWIAAAEEALRTLATQSGEAVDVVGFSMGALLSVVLAAHHPQYVRCLALLAPAARLRGLPAAAARRLRRWRWLDRFAPYQVKGPPDVEDPVVRASTPSLPRFPTARLWDLFELQDLANRLAPATNAPSLLVLAAHDHVVDARAARRLYGRLPGAGPEVILPRGFHGLARDLSRQELARSVVQFLSLQAGRKESA